MGYIPTVGFWIALIPPVLIAWQQQGVQTAIFVFLGYVLINGSVQNFIQPRMMGQGLGISPVIVFISLFVWGWLLGGVGAILAVPLTLLIMAILNSNDNTRFLATLMSLTPAPKQEDRTTAKGQLAQHWENIKKDLRGENADPQAAQSVEGEDPDQI
jgi:predicted PurR-regulated permease PerM